MSEDKPPLDIHAMFGVDKAPPPYGRTDVEENLEPVAGDRIIGTLGGNMPDAFCEMTILEMELEEFSQKLRERAVSRVSNLILEGEMDMSQIMSQALDHGLFDSELEASEIFEKQALYYKLHSEFWYNVRTLFDCWNEWLAIRHDFHIVSLGKKFAAGK
jgi:hypothetical protein